MIGSVVVMLGGGICGYDGGDSGYSTMVVCGGECGSDRQKNNRPKLASTKNLSLIGSGVEKFSTRTNHRRGSGTRGVLLITSLAEQIQQEPIIFNDSRRDLLN